MKLATLCAWAFVALSAVGCCRPKGAPSAEPTPGATTTSTATPDAAAPHFGKQHLEEHFQKHGAEVGASSKEDYQAKAQTLVKGGAGVDTLKQKDGDTCFFKESTGEFAVLSDKNIIRTYFRPKDGRKYFERQRDK